LWLNNESLTQEYKKATVKKPSECIDLLNKMLMNYGVEATQEGVVHGYGLVATQVLPARFFIPAVGRFSSWYLFASIINRSVAEAGDTQVEKEAGFNAGVVVVQRWVDTLISHPAIKANDRLESGQVIFVHHPACPISRTNSSVNVEENVEKKQPEKTNCVYTTVDDDAYMASETPAGMAWESLGLRTAREIQIGEELLFEYRILISSVGDIREDLGAFLTSECPQAEKSASWMTERKSKQQRRDEAPYTGKS
jgi:hypothetical protein